MQITLGQLVNYVKSNRKNRAFLNYPEPAIAQELLDCLRLNTLRYAVSPSGTISGVVCFKTIEESKILYVNQLICTEKWVLASFIDEFTKQFIGWSIESTDSCGRHLVYNTDKLIRRIMRKSNG